MQDSGLHYRDGLQWLRFLFSFLFFVQCFVLEYWEVFCSDVRTTQYIHSDKMLHMCVQISKQLCVGDTSATAPES